MKFKNPNRDKRINLFSLKHFSSNLHKKVNYIDYLDKKILVFIHQKGWVEPQILWYFFSQKYLWFLLGFFILWRLQKSNYKKILVIIFIFGICILLTDRISSGFFKPFFQRLRPCHQEELKPFLILYKNHCGGQFGFISSHAANIWGWISLYFLQFSIHKFEKYFWIFIATMITLSRLMLGVHFLTDLLMGMLLGIIIAICINKTYKKISFSI